MHIKLAFDPEDNLKNFPMEMDVVPRVGEFILIQGGHEFEILRVVYEFVAYGPYVRLDLGRAQQPHEATQE